MSELNSNNLKLETAEGRVVTETEVFQARAVLSDEAGNIVDKTVEIDLFEQFGKFGIGSKSAFDSLAAGKSSIKVKKIIVREVLEIVCEGDIKSAGDDCVIEISGATTIAERIVWGD